MNNYIYQSVIAILSVIVLWLGVSYWSTNSNLESLTTKYDKIVVELKMETLQKEAFINSIKISNEKIKQLEEREKAHQLEIDKANGKIEIRYKERIKLIKDLNGSAECEAIKGIIDEEFDSNTSN